MSLDKSISSGKEKRKKYRGAKATDHTCRNHGSCSYCERNRKYNTKKRLISIKDQEEEAEIYLLEQQYDKIDTTIWTK